MTLKEAKMTIYANVVYACEKAGFSPCTTALVKDACDTVIALAEKADTPQTDCPKMTEEEFDTMLAKVLVGQTESTGSPIGDYRDGVGAWQTEKTPAGCSKSWSAACTYCERYFSCDYLSGRQTDCGWGEPITVSHSKDKED